MGVRLTRIIVATLTLAHIQAASQDKQVVALGIEKMFCVLDVQVDVSKKLAIVRFDATKATVDDLTKATAKAGFPAAANPAAK